MIQRLTYLGKDVEHTECTPDELAGTLEVLHRQTGLEFIQFLALPSKEPPQSQNQSYSLSVFHT